MSAKKRKKSWILSIEGDLKEYNVEDAKVGEIYALKVVKRTKKAISFDFERINRNKLK